MKKISVIIPLYNKEKIVRRSIESVLSQSFEDFEVIVVDDGSIDGSVAAVESFNDERIHIIRQENGGPSKARNTGTRAANGEWVVFLDADDELLPGALDIFWGLVIKHKDVDMTCCGFYDNRENGRFQRIIKEGVIDNPFKEFVLNKFITRTGACMCKKEICLNNLFDEHIRRNEDYDVWFRMFDSAKVIGSNTMVLCVNTTFAEASFGRKQISEDFVGYLQFAGKPFWKKMALYKLYLENRILYPHESQSLIRTKYSHYGYFIVYKLLSMMAINPVSKI